METEEDATDRMRNDIEEVFDNDTNRLTTVQVRILFYLKFTKFQKAKAIVDDLATKC